MTTLIIWPAVFCTYPGALCVILRRENDWRVFVFRSSPGNRANIPGIRVYVLYSPPTPTPAAPSTTTTTAAEAAAASETAGSYERLDSRTILLAAAEWLSNPLRVNGVVVETVVWRLLWEGVWHGRAEEPSQSEGSPSESSSYSYILQNNHHYRHRQDYFVFVLSPQSSSSGDQLNPIQIYRCPYLGEDGLPQRIIY